MAHIPKIRSLELFASDAGWRNYHFVKITTEDNVVGWSELDEALAHLASVRRSSGCRRGYGVWQSMKFAASAEAHEVSVAPHNFYGHLCTVMNAHFCAAVPNLRIMETDIDRLAWDQELFTHLPEFEDGYLVIPDRPGWGTAPNEEGLSAHPPKGNVGLLNSGRKG